MPEPVSLTLNTMCGVVSLTAPPASSAERTRSVRIVSVPPPSLASRALIARFRIAASNCAGSSLHGQWPCPSSSRSSILRSFGWG
jgi:hypothetical protein